MSETNTKTQRRIVHLKRKSSNARGAHRALGPSVSVGPSVSLSKPMCVQYGRADSKYQEGAYSPKRPTRPKAEQFAISYSDAVFSEGQLRRRQNPSMLS